MAGGAAGAGGMTVRTWCLWLGVLLWLIPQTARAVCVGNISVQGAALVGSPAQWDGWHQWLHTALVVAGEEVGPVLPDERCREAALTGKLTRRNGGWSFQGKLGGDPVKGTGRDLAGWYAASRSWVSLTPSALPVPAEAELRAWTQQSPKSGTPYLEARRVFTRLVQGQATGAARLFLALQLHKRENPDFARARTMLQTLHRDYPQSPGVGMALGELCMLLVDETCAAEVFQSVVTARGDLVKPWAYLFVLAQSRDDGPGQVTALQRVLLLEPGNAYYQYQMALVLTKEDHLQEALTHLAKAVKAAPEFREQARTDVDLQPLRRVPGWGAVVGE